MQIVQQLCVGQTQGASMVQISDFLTLSGAAPSAAVGLHP